jgi:hypothetical protein
VRNSRPKSELPKIKEEAATDKDKQARQRSIDTERQARESDAGKKKKYRQR